MLRYAADLRTLAFVVIYYAVTLYGFFNFDTLPWQAIVPLAVTACLFSFFSAVIVHNTIHCPIFKQRWLNKFFQHILSFAYGHAVSAYVPGHNFSHHKYVQTSKDVIRTTKMRWRWNFLNQLFFFHTMSGDILRDEIAFAKSMRKRKPAWFRQYIAELVVVFSIQGVLLYLNWQAFLVLVFIPHHYAVWGIVGTNFWQHDGCDESHPYNHTRNFTDKVLNFFAFNNGFHGMHHERASLHWSLLPEWHEKQIRPNLHPNLNQKSLLKYLWKAHIYPGKRLTYLGKPVVLPPKTPDADWISELKIDDHQLDLGAVS